MTISFEQTKAEKVKLTSLLNTKDQLEDGEYELSKEMMINRLHRKLVG